MIRHDRLGFTLLEALVAIVIVGLAVVSATAAFGAELRAANRIRHSVPTAIVAEQRVTALSIVPTPMLSMLPDSLSRGETHSGVETYAWNTTIRQRSNERSLYDVTVAISWENGSYTLRTSLFRTMPVMVLRQ